MKTTPLKTTVAFGRTGLTLDLPAGPDYQILHARSAPAMPDIDQALADALDNPIGSAPLLSLAQGKRTAAISVCDITRPAPNRVTLPPILDRLHRAGLRAEDITLCIATGLHRIATPAELDTILGTTIAARYPIYNHDARNLHEHRLLGTTTRGTPAWVATPFLDADLRISLGFIEQHLMLGFSGGRKLVAPGLAAQQTIKVIHSPRFMREALATEGSIDDNPLHDELLQIARLAGHDFLLDVTLTHDRGISGVFAGEPVAAHAAGVAHLRSTSVQHLGEPVDAVITTSAGHPLDLTLYQGVKGVSAVQHILKPGAPILTLAACEEGIGSPEFSAKVAAFTTPQAFLDEVKDAPVVADQWQLEKLALIALKHPVLLYIPGADPAHLGGLRSMTYPTPAAAIKNLLAGLPPNARVAIVPDGPYACLRL